MNLSLDLGAKQIRVIKDAEVLTPVAQATVNTYADVAGSKIDVGCKTSLAIVCKNTHGSHSLDWKVLASIDDATYVEAQAEATLTFGSVGTYTTTQALYRYYKVQVKSTGAGDASEATVHVISK
jgi:hypothetical protein